MRNFLRNAARKVFLYPLLHLIHRIISLILDQAPHPDNETYAFYEEEELRNCYNHFKKYFHQSIFLPSIDEIRDYAIYTAISNHQKEYYYMEFGVWMGTSIKRTSKILETLNDDTVIYGFDSFQGLKDDWKGYSIAKGSFNLSNEIPRLNDNCKIVEGWIEDTLPKFTSEHKDLQINYVHVDTDTYSSTKVILKDIKPYLVDNAIIIFDDFYNFPGWSVGEYKALIEELEEQEFTYLAFSKTSHQVVIQFNKI